MSTSRARMDVPQHHPSKAGLLRGADARTASADRLPLRWGKILEVASEAERETLTVISSAGRTELTIELTPTGARVVLDAAEVAVRSTKTVDVDCDTFRVAARQFEVRAQEKATICAQDASLAATVGNVVITANDDVKVHGERVLLNCDSDVRVPMWLRDRLSARLAGKGPDMVPAADVSGDEELVRQLSDILNPTKQEP